MEYPLIKVEELSVCYIKKNIFGKVIQSIKAIDNISFQIKEGLIVGLVGESGSGKTTLGKTLLKLINPTCGKIFYKNFDITNLPEKQFRPLRKEIQMIFQDPYTSLNPRMTIQDIIAEPLINLTKLSKNEIREKVSDIAKKCKIHKHFLSRFPYALSGGQRQRVAIARALVINPKFIVCDEPVSALDVSTQAQILNLLIELKEILKLTLLFIGHDLNVVSYISDEIIVMYRGKIVESGSVEEIFQNPLHPYTKLLMNSIPDINRKNIFEVKNNDKTYKLSESGCNFYPRCNIKKKICQNFVPSLKRISENHYVACHLVD